MKRAQTILITTVMLSITLASVFALDFENANSLESQIPFAAEAAKSSTHNITMEAVAMPDGLYAYRMVEYTIDDGNELVERAYSGKPSIPGPTIIMTEGDDANITLINNACDDTYVDGPGHPVDGLIDGSLPKYNENSLLGIHVHGVHYDITDDATYGRMNMNGDSGAGCNQSIEYHWVASAGTAGAWPYHDHTFSINEIGGEELGLFGTVIINPGNGQLNGFVDDNGQVGSVNYAEIEKEFVLWMVSSEVLGSSIFYGNEIDYSTSNYQGNYGWRETALWTNPNLVTTEGGKYRFHVLGLGEETHAFHLHGHRWTDDIHEKANFEDVIDVKEITPLQRHTFIIEASANDDAELSDDNEEMWMYHCHFVDHMKQGMSGMMSVLPGSDDLPVIGAVFTLSDEPGLWMKTLDAGVADQLDNILVDLGVPIQARNGTGFPLGYISDALEAIDEKGTGFSNSEGRSLAVINKGETVLFGMKDSQTKHTITTLIYPDAATRLGGNGILNSVDAILESDISHFDQQLGIRGSTLLVDKEMKPVGLDEPGLYVFVCKIHPYMFSAVVVDDPETNLYIGGLDYGGDLPITPEILPAFPLLDFSDNLVVITRSGTDVHLLEDETVFPTKVGPGSGLARSLLTTFFVITDPNNWRDYQDPTWNVHFPPVVITTNNEETALALAHDDGDLVDIVLALRLSNSTGQIPEFNAGLDYDIKDMANPGLIEPGTDGVGEVLVNTQFERTVGKNFDGTPFDKPGTITAVDTTSWTVDRKISLPEINMNHPHNMWTDAKNEVIYQTEWFGSEMAIIDRETGELIKEVYAGQSPSHVMTSPETGDIYVAVNGEDAVFEFDSETYEITRQLSTGFRSHPHGHWISSDGQYVVTPDFLGLKASILDLEGGMPAASTAGTDAPTGVLFGPIATGMKGNTALFSDNTEAVFYTADFLGNSMSGLNIDGEIVDEINFLSADLFAEHGLLGLPIQTPISPDDQWMVTALTLGGKIALIDVSGKDAVVEAIIPCDPGCHGVQWGAKSGGDGYYAYVSSKFSNVMLVVDPEANDSEPDPYIVGRIALYDRNADIDDPVIGYDGFGGQGVLAIPNVYTGWFEQSQDACSIENACSDKVNGWLEAAD
jgi:FtsP/CotA-like multicopper oxidase with cupredoxin domain/DNA-binding beta-propeller fold protein YncE/plastocyanin